MLEALWSVEFGSNLNIFGSGVVVFETGRLFGGDAQYYYTGKYEVKNGILEGELNVVNYGGKPWSVFGTLSQFLLSFSGEPSHDKFDIEGALKEDPSKKILIRLTRRAELP